VVLTRKATKSIVKNGYFCRL